MNGYEQRLAHDKAEIRRRVVEVGDQVRKAVARAVEGLVELDHTKCYRIMLGDLPVNREVRAINKLCHAFIARHLPSAGHLRFVSSVLQLNIALERIGDYAVSISREAVQLGSCPPETLAEQLRELARQADTVLGGAMKAFAEQNPELARETKPQASFAGNTFARIYRELTQKEVPRRRSEAFALLTVAHRLGRVADQAKNICEETLFETAGETKPPKRYQVLFVDARDTLIAPLAAALACKAFPESGHFSSAGHQAGEALASELTALADELSLDLSGVRPTPLPQDRDSLAKYHVIVGLGANVRSHIEEVPYTTIFLEWDVPKIADATTGEALQGRLREVSQHLSHEIHELMVMLRGEGAC